MPKRFLFIFALFFFVGNIHSQQSVPPEYTLFVFEGSDWCASCRKLDKVILSDESMIEFFTNKKIEVTKVDFPQRKKLNKSVVRTNALLAEQYNFDGSFPTLILSEGASPRYYRLEYSNQDVSEFKRDIESVLRQFQ